MLIPGLKSQNVASHNGRIESTAENVADYPSIDWSNVPTPNTTASSQKIKWEANCSFQQTTSSHPDTRSDTMLKYCNEFFSSWQKMNPPSEESEVNNNTEAQPLTSAASVIPHQFNIMRPTTPPVSISVTDMLSPNTVNEVRSTIRALFPNGPPPPPPVVPVKRHKKGDKAYIVGCTERPRVPEKRSLSVFKGDRYGINKDTNDFNDDEECPAKRRRGKRIQYPNWSKSRFNPKSEEIAATLKRNENVVTTSRTPNNSSVPYMSTPYTPRPPNLPFVPLPSTSKDSETIMKNEKHFSESLKYKNYPDGYDYDDDDADLPDIQWEPRVTNSEQKHTPLTESNNIDLACSEEPSSSVKSEDLNNNNNNSPDRIDLTEIQFDKYKPKKQFPLPIKVNTSTVNEPIVIDDVCLGDAFYERRPPQADTQSNLLNDEYNSITHEDLYSQPQRVETVDLDELFKDLNNFQRKKKPINQDIITIVDPNELRTSFPNRRPEVRPIQRPANVSKIAAVRPIYRRQSLFRDNSTIDTGETVDITNFIDPATRLAPNQPSTSSDSVHFFGERVANRNLAEDSSTTTDDDDDDTDPEVTDRLGSDFCRYLFGHFFSQERLARDDEMIARKRAERLQRSQQRRCRKKKTKTPSKKSKENNENAAPVTNAQADTSTNNSNGERRLGDCPICMDNLSRGAIASTTCGHVFCLDCIKTCLRTNGKSCPTCRKKLKGAGYHQVFL